MRNKLTPVAASVGYIVRGNTRFALGIAVGVSVMFAGYAASAVSSGNSILGNASSQLLSQQTSVVADSIKADTEACATGTLTHVIATAIARYDQVIANLENLLMTRVPEARELLKTLFGGAIELLPKEDGTLEAKMAGMAAGLFSLFTLTPGLLTGHQINVVAGARFCSKKQILVS